MLQTSHLSFRHPGASNWVVDDVNLKIYASEIITLMGPNGSGKSTLAKLLLGFLKPEKGQIQQKSGLRLGYLPQARDLSSAAPSIPMTAERYLALHPHGSLGSPVLKAALQHGGFKSNWLQYPFSKLSGGQRQMLLLTRALLNQPQLLILDEPSCHLDLEAQQQWQASLLKIKKESACALLIISHDLHVVMARSDRVLCFNQSILCTGSPADLQSSHAFHQFIQKSGFAHGWAFYAHGHHREGEPSLQSTKDSKGACFHV